tara:strand:+ start:3034 stop:4029 length:996 start_codon:yes stop_codon:yes gene_type:complete
MSFDQKILIIRFSSIGDIILATSPLKTIRLNYPKARITFLTLNQFVPLLEFHHDIDEVIGIQRNKSIQDLWNFSTFIKDKQYDITYDLHNSLRSKLLTMQISNPIYQLQKPRWNRFMLFQFHKNQFSENFSTRKMYHQHLGNIWKNGDEVPGTSLFVSKAEKSFAIKLLKSNSIEGPYLSIVPGSAWRQKQWSIKKYISLIKKIEKDVVIIGSSKDKICFQIAEKLPDALNLAGKTTLRQSLAILSQSDYVVGSDTGLLHAAEALDVAVTMILGPTSRQTGAGAYLDSSTIIEDDVWCRPCSQNGSIPCYRKTQVCMDSISVKDIFNSIPN